MKLLLVLLSTISVASAFIHSQVELGRCTNTQLFEYIPDGMTPQQWRQLKEKEKSQAAQKKFAAYGPQSFKSRSLQAFQSDLEKGKAGHLLPVFNAKELVKKGKLKVEDIPYMQRGGSWDNSDVKGAQKKSWTETDKKYQANQAPVRPDWMGTVERKGPQSKNQPKVESPPKPAKKLFGLF